MFSQRRRSRRKTRQARRAASQIILDEAARNPVHSVSNLVPAASRRVGRSISVIQVPSGEIATDGLTVEDDSTGAFTIKVSKAAPLEVTLAHELGHIVLGHGGCFSIEDLESQASRDGLAMWHQAVDEALRHQGMMAEYEADAFADQVLHLLEYTRKGISIQGLRWAIGNTS